MGKKKSKEITPALGILYSSDLLKESEGSFFVEEDFFSINLLREIQVSLFDGKNPLVDLCYEALSLYNDINNHPNTFIPEKFDKLINSYKIKRPVKDVFTFVTSVTRRCSVDSSEDLENLVDLSCCCWIVFGYSIDIGVESDEELIDLLKSSFIIMEATNKAIGYWTAMQKIRNPGAEAMKKKNKDNIKALKQLLEEMRINDTAVFRSDKTKRELFVNKAKEKTSLTSEDRIFRLSRAELKKKKTKS